MSTSIYVSPSLRKYVVRLRHIQFYKIQDPTLLEHFQSLSHNFELLPVHDQVRLRAPSSMLILFDKCPHVIRNLQFRSSEFLILKLLIVQPRYPESRP